VVSSEEGFAPDAVTVGVDYGTLSGRAVVVRVSDGAELGSAVHAYGHAVLTDRLPATGEPLPPEWALQVPQDYRDVLRVAVPRSRLTFWPWPELAVCPLGGTGLGAQMSASTLIFFGMEDSG